MISKDNPIVIVATQRTPIGQFQGCFSDITAPQLGGHAINATLASVKMDPQHIDEVIMGCVLPAGLGQAPARQAAKAAGIPNKAAAVTVNKMCGSGMKAIMLGIDSIKAGTNQCVVAGGMENMTLAPYLLPKARGGLRMGHGEVKDHMFLDGLEDVYNKGTLMGVFAELCAEKYGFTRQMQDEFAIQSLKRAQYAIEHKLFKNEISALEVQTKKGAVLYDTDELPLNAKLDKITTLKPAFKKDGTVTAANASGISDGASAHLIMSLQEAQKHKLPVLARIEGHATHSQDPSWFTTAPVGAIQKLLAQLNWSAEEVDLYEINEAFAVVTLAAMKDLKLPSEKVNIHGGACALGHPIGASGARILTTLIYALRTKGLSKGVASLCIGGGEATAIAITLMD